MSQLTVIMSAVKGFKYDLKTEHTTTFDEYWVQKSGSPTTGENENDMSEF